MSEQRTMVLAVGMAILTACGTPARGQAVRSASAFLSVTIQAAPTTVPERSRELAIRNTGQKPISAYRITIAVADQKGNVSMDDFIEDLVPSFPSAGRSAPGRYVHNGPLLPGEVRFFPYTPPVANQDIPTLATVATVVFLDNTYAGDREHARAIFDQRRAIANGLADALTRMRGSRASRNDLASLRQRLILDAQGTRSRSSSGNGRSIGLTMVAQRIRDIMESADADPARLQETFSESIDVTAAELRAYVEHSTLTEESK